MIIFLFLKLDTTMCVQICPHFFRLGLNILLSFIFVEFFNLFLILIIHLDLNFC